jgi:hypothetical protein
MIIASIAVLLIYQGCSCSITGIASPWITKTSTLINRYSPSFCTDVSFRVRHAYPEIGLPTALGRQPIILKLRLRTFFQGEASISRYPASFALFEILIYALLGCEVH